MHIILKLKVIAANISLQVEEAADFVSHLEDSLKILKTVAVTPGTQNLDGTCRNNRDWKQSTREEYNCGDIQFVEERSVELCQIEAVHLNCPIACGICCEDDSEYIFTRNNGINADCVWLAESEERPFFFVTHFETD